jgi:hypothetical protein
VNADCGFGIFRSDIRNGRISLRRGATGLLGFSLLSLFILQISPPVSKKLGKKTAAPVRTTMRLDPELKAALDKAAADDKRNATPMTTKILSDWLKERGYLK